MKKLLIIGAAVIAVLGMHLTALADEAYVESDGTSGISTGQRGHPHGDRRFCYWKVLLEITERFW